MYTEFRCQNEACSITFKGQITHDVVSDGPCVICPNCGAKHVAVEKIGVPDGPDSYRFQLCRKPSHGPSDGGG
jgi:hypothetical protein